jgi:hypothetical protein
MNYKNYVKFFGSILLAGASAMSAAALPVTTKAVAPFPVKLVSAYYGETNKPFTPGNYLNVTYLATPGLTFCVVIGAHRLDLGPKWAQQGPQCATANETGRATIAVTVPRPFRPDALLLLTTVLVTDEVHTDALKLAKFVR